MDPTNLPSERSPARRPPTATWRPRPSGTLLGRVRARRARGERGAAAVEAAIILPLLIFVMFGIFEVALLVNDTLLISQASRSAVRTAVAMPRDPGFDSSAVEAAAGVLGIDTSGDIDQLIIYKADPATGKLLGGGDLATCASSCIHYTWDDNSEVFVKSSGTWPADTQMACGSQAASDFVGVQITGHHEWATGLFGDGISLTERAVMRLEPKMGGSCGRVST